MTYTYITKPRQEHLKRLLTPQKKSPRKPKTNTGAISSSSILEKILGQKTPSTKARTISRLDSRGQTIDAVYNTAYSTNFELVKPRTAINNSRNLFAKIK